MKTTKKLLALLLSAILLLSLLPAAFATEPEAQAAATTYSLTITGTQNGRKYELYQVFTGALHTDENGNKILSDVVYGASWSDQTVGTAVDEATLNSYVTASSGKINIDAFLPHKAATAFKTVNAVDDKATFADLPAGYYVVLEVGEVGGHAAKSEHIIQVVGDTEVAAKMDVPTSQKKVKDTNDSVANSTTGWQDSADYDIGDDVPFQLTATVAKNILDFKGPYALTFHDKQSAGLTFNRDSVVVKIDGKTVTTGYAVVTEGIADGCTFHVHFDDLKAYNKEGETAVVTKNSVITVEYTSKLNENAEIGSIGNPNEMHITFSNNPNSDQPEENGETPKDKVIVFTFLLDVFKYDGTKGETQTSPLVGAEFALYKVLPGGTEKLVKQLTKDDALDPNYPNGIPEGTTGTVKFVYKFKGLDDGTYKLVETKAPDGYNTAAPVTFEITATHDEESADPKLLTLNVPSPFTTNNKNIHVDVYNYRGNTLPSTGGMGTTIFYVLGSILAVGAAILLVSKKRMNGAR